MNKLDFLIHYLLEENKNIIVEKILTDEEGKKKVWRSLCNIRDAKPISKEYLQIEGEYLQEELKKKKITNAKDIKPIAFSIREANLDKKDKICLWKGDITTLQIDAIVNAANSQGLGCFIPCHKCIDNQIHTFAGISLRLECNEIMKKKDYYLKTGEAFITKGYNLPAKYIIHTVGPIIQDKVTKIEETQLANCYTNSLQLAMKEGIRTIAFPCISTGEFKFPKEKASKIAILAIENFLKDYNNHFDKIVFNVYNEEDYNIYEQNIGENRKSKELD